MQTISTESQIGDISCLSHIQCSPALPPPPDSRSGPVLEAVMLPDLAIYSVAVCLLKQEAPVLHATGRHMNNTVVPWKQSWCTQLLPSGAFPFDSSHGMQCISVIG